MAFPVSPSNNDVWKEGNRAFVWDSTLGTWDQVRETLFLIMPPYESFPAGHILQVVDSKKTDTSSVNNDAWANIGGTDQDGAGSVWCCKITPKSTSSKILVCAGIVYGRKNGNNSAQFLFVRDSTSIFKGDIAGNRTQAWNFGYGNSDTWGAQASAQFLDSPNTTSEVTYKVQHRSEGTTYYSYINRSHSDTNATHNGFRGASVITLMEVAG